MSTNYTEVNPEELTFVSVIEEGEIDSGERIIASFDDFNVVVFNIAGKIFAIGDVCSHDDGPISEGELNEYTVDCPRHGAKFDVRSGKALSAPAFVDIPAYPVRVTDGHIEVGVPL